MKLATPVQINRAQVSLVPEAQLGCCGKGHNPGKSLEILGVRRSKHCQSAAEWLIRGVWREPFP